MKGPFISIAFLLAIITCGQDQQTRIGEIEFYGYSGINLDQIRMVLPIREGQMLSPESAPNVKRQLRNGTMAKLQPCVFCSNFARTDSGC